jgi:hypothetical protein
MNSAPIIEFTLCHAKLACLSVVTIAAAVVEGVATLTPADVSDWENLTFKGFLILVIVYLVRESSKERSAHQRQAEEREDRVVEVVKKNTETSLALLAETKRQTSFFDGVSQDVVKSALRTPAPNNHQ